MSDPITDLKRAETRYRRAVESAVAARAKRDEAIRAAIRSGRTHADVFRELDGTITRARIGQIAIEGKDKEDGS